MRREFLLSDGRRSMLGSTDMEVNIINATVVTANGSAIVVQELFGQDKSPLFRPTEAAVPKTWSG